ncbi:hypothetical protein BU16DRAFT_294255 [Lophium mytilinum]|uniref:Uncharacterized protein n=1 Tax=Lophium mytilinum TaxID=390894 RepID=A0A6A6R0Y5_9PEZI|nr:hypothetical protein BU16DRAFT_294255 [Lophium mytilinum]
MPAMFSKRSDCVEDFNGDIQCYQYDGFWYTTKGEIIKWCILAAIFVFFMAWFLGGYIHAKSRLRKGLPLLAYHRWLVPLRDRQRYGQTPYGQAPQNHFTFYNTQQQQYQQQPYRANDGTYFEPPPVYNHDAPPSYVPPPGATKLHPQQNAMEMRPHVGSGSQEPGGYGMAPGYSGPAGQETGVVGGGQPSDIENQSAELPPRPQRAKLAVGNLLGKLRR